MQNLVIIACLLVSAVVVRRTKFPLHPLIVFNVLWALILSLESMHLFGLFVSRDLIYQLIYWGIISFDIGYLVYSAFRSKFSFGDRASLDGSYVPRYQLLYVLAYICIAFYFRDALTSFQLLLSGNSMGQIRELIQANSSLYTSSGSKIVNALLVLIVTPGAQVVELVGAIDYWNGNKHKQLFYLALALMLLSSISEGGRTSIVSFLVYMLTGYMFSNVKLTRNAKQLTPTRHTRQYSLFFTIGLLVAFLGWFTVSRTGQTFAKNIYLYFAMEPYMFDLWARRVDELNLWGFTEASLNGFSFAGLYVLKNILGAPFPAHWQAIYDLIRSTDSQWQIVTNISTQANAYVSGFWFLYLDGRLPGVVSGMLIYGGFMAGRYASAIKFRSVRSVSLLAFSIQGLLYFFIRFPFSNIYYAIAFFMILTIAFRKDDLYLRNEE